MPAAKKEISDGKIIADSVAFQPVNVVVRVPAVADIRARLRRDLAVSLANRPPAVIVQTVTESRSGHADSFHEVESARNERANVIATV